MSSGGSSGGVKIAPPGPVEILLENSILDALNLFGKDPNAMIPSAAMIASFVNYATKLIEAEKLYRELPKEFDETLTPIVKEYKGKLEGIADELGLNFEDLKETVDVLKGQFGENLDEFKKNFEEYREAYGDYEQALKKLGEEAKGYAKVYQTDLQRIQRTPGVQVSFGGQPMFVRKPLHTMATELELAKQKYEGGLADIATRGGLQQEIFSGAEDVFGGARDVFAGGLQTLGSQADLAKGLFTSGLETGKTQADLAGRGFQAEMNKALQYLTQKEAFPARLLGLAKMGMMPWEELSELYKSIYAARMGTARGYTEQKGDFWGAFLPAAAEVASAVILD